MFNPELIDGSDLEQWSSRREMQELLPWLVRSLLAATPGVTGLSIRSGEGIGLPGWDGRADGGPGAPYVPSGPGVWEIGSGEDARAKAQADYRKRTDDPGEIDPVATAFVFVTSRRWRDKEDWLEARRGEGKWREVRALDTDDLEGWLDANPAVHIRLSERMGRVPGQVQTLTRWWDTWSSQTRPPIPRGLLLAGREAEAENVRDRLMQPPAPFLIHAGSREEATAFLAAALGGKASNEELAYSDPLATVLIVSSLVEKHGSALPRWAPHSF